MLMTGEVYSSYEQKLKLDYSQNADVIFLSGLEASEEEILQTPCVGYLRS